MISAANLFDALTDAYRAAQRGHGINDSTGQLFMGKRGATRALLCSANGVRIVITPHDGEFVVAVSDRPDGSFMFVNRDSVAFDAGDPRSEAELAGAYGALLAAIQNLSNELALKANGRH